MSLYSDFGPRRTRQIIGDVLALATQKISALSKVSADPMAAWRRGDEAVMRSLAQLELKSSGVRMPD